MYDISSLRVNENWILSSVSGYSFHTWTHVYVSKYGGGTDWG